LPRRKAKDSSQKGFGDALFGSRLSESLNEVDDGLPKAKGSDLFIVDNSDDDWNVKTYLSQWTDIASRFDITTGYFEIGVLLALDGQWQQLDKLRILMGGLRYSVAEFRCRQHYPRLHFILAGVN
jgi:hypothetical protein